MEEKKVKIYYEPHLRQKQFHESKRKFRAFVGGIGSGKTIAGVIETITFCINNPGCLFAIAAPTYTMLRDVDLRTFFEYCPKELILSYNSSDNIIKLVNGSEILCRSCEDLRTIERLRGLNLAGFWIDEGAMVPYMAWKVLLGRLRQVGYTLKAWVTTSPRGFNWIWSEFVEKKDDNYTLIPCSSRENPYLSKEYVDDLERSYTGVFARQEIEGQFVGFEGCVYEFDRKIHVQMISANPNKYFNKYIAGVDWGYTNPSVIVVMGVDSDDRLYIVEEFYKSKILIDDLVGVANQLKTKYNIQTFYCDPSEPQFIVKFRMEGLNAVKGNNEVVAGINEVNNRLKVRGDDKPRLFVDEWCTNTIVEFENYRYPESKDLKEVKEEPVKLYDHAMDAVRYACMGASFNFNYSPTIG